MKIYIDVKITHYSTLVVPKEKFLRLTLSDTINQYFLQHNSKQVYLKKETKLTSDEKISGPKNSLYPTSMKTLSLK